MQFEPRCVDGDDDNDGDDIRVMFECLRWHRSATYILTYGQGTRIPEWFAFHTSIEGDMDVFSKWQILILATNSDTH